MRARARDTTTLDPRTVAVVSNRTLYGHALLRPHQLAAIAGHALAVVDSTLFVGVPDDKPRILGRRRVERVAVSVALVPALVARATVARSALRWLRESAPLSNRGCISGPRCRARRSCKTGVACSVGPTSCCTEGSRSVRPEACIQPPAREGRKEAARDEDGLARAEPTRIDCQLVGEVRTRKLYIPISWLITSRGLRNVCCGEYCRKLETRDV